jgi:fluoride exporter
MLSYLGVALGSAVGGIARYHCGLLAAEWLGDGFPWGTIFVNILGSFVIGFFATLTGPDGRLFVRAEVRVFVMVGFCGGYTTFSAFSLQTLELLQAGNVLGASANVVLSMALCLGAVWLGHMSASSLNRPPVGPAAAEE